MGIEWTTFSGMMWSLLNMKTTVPMKLTLPLVLSFVSVQVVAQWTPVGSPMSGMSDNDKLGDFNTIALDEAGNTIAIGTPYSSAFGPVYGYAMVMDWNGSAWVQRGTFFPGSLALEGTGAAVDLSADGNTVVVSSPWGPNALGYECGVVNVYDWDGSDWVQRGSQIDGEGNPSPLFSTDVFGLDVDLSPDGNFLAIGAPNNTQQVGVMQGQGHCRVYQWDGTDWVQMGQDLDGEDSGEEFGLSVSISDDGGVLAVGGRGFRIWSGGQLIATEVGIVRTYTWDGSQWILRGPAIQGALQGDLFGSTVSLSSTGSSLSIGSPGANSLSGFTRILDWNGTAWLQRGADIPGASGDRSGSSVAMSGNGNLVAIGDPWMNGFNGGAKVFGWNGSSWFQIHSNMQGIGPNTGINAFGTAVAMNAGATVVAVGAPFHDFAGNNSGLVYVFENATFTGVLENTNSAEVCFPNPTTGEVFLTGDRINGPVQVVDGIGRTVLVSVLPVSSTVQRMDLSSLPAGLYHLVTADRQWSAKVMKQ
jgi:hypothetical protein